MRDEAPPPLGKGTGFSSYSPAIGDAKHYAQWVLSCFDDALHGSILEVGLGHASYFPALSRRGRYCGIDVDAQVVAEARRRYPEGTFVQADITAPPFAESVGANFDAIVC